jgi:DnaK suppressor protein
LRTPDHLDTTQGQDIGDRGAAESRTALDFQFNENACVTLRQIDEAIARIATGTYGICEVTGDLIPIERLRALPFARCTAKAQERLERTMSSGRSRQVGMQFEDRPEEPS